MALLGFSGLLLQVVFGLISAHVRILFHLIGSRYNNVKVYKEKVTCEQDPESDSSFL